MITLRSGANTVKTTLEELTTLTSPTYVFLFENDDTKEKFACSNSYTRVDGVETFTITVQASPSWLSGQVVLSKLGDYHYYVYECSDPISLVYNTIISTDIEDLVPTVFTTMVECGKMQYLGTDETINSYRNDTETVKAYGN